MKMQCGCGILYYQDRTAGGAGPDRVAKDGAQL